MSTNYEFRSQTTKQKIILYATRGFVLVLICFAIYTVGWGVDQSLGAKLRNVSGVFVYTWIYCNLLEVEIEIQELFVPPYNIWNGVEFLIIAAPLLPLSYFL